MTLHREQRRVITFECDGCGLTLETGEGDFIDALRVLRDRGWAPEKTEDGEWRHYCVDCAGKRDPFGD